MRIRKFSLWFLLSVLMLTEVGCGSSLTATSEGETIMNLQITSSAFTEGSSIPKKHTCDAEDASPNLAWSGIPAGARSLALIVDDPDAPGKTWVHWVIYNITPNLAGLPEGVVKSATVEGIGAQGVNDFRQTGYGGPCPPRGKPHRYFFKLYALDVQLNLKSGATKTELEKAMQGHILAQGQLMGTYGR